jgi:SulP family sulfate permease
MRPPLSSGTITSSLLSRVFPFVLWLPRVNRSTLKADLFAGITGSILGLPQGVAFAILAGLPPQYGLYAAMIPPALAALFGSSWHMVAGPTNAVAILLFASLGHLASPGSADYINLVLTVAFLTGLFELVMGVARLGTLVNFISHTVIVGFSAGAAILIGTQQLKSFLGIPIPPDASFVQTLRQTMLQIGHINPWVTSVGLFTIVSGLLAKRYLKRIPFMISATIAGSLFALALDAYFGRDVTGISTVGQLPATLPPFSVPDLSIGALTRVAPTALATTILALTLGISVGRTLGIRSGQRIDANQEFIGQGISNLVGSFFSSYTSAGSFNRSAANFEAGAKTPLASVFSSIFLVGIVLVVAPLAAYLPLATVAGILFLIAYGLVDVRRMKAIFITSRTEASVMIVTLLAALFLGLQTAIYAGVLLSLLLFLNQAARPGIRDVKPEFRGGHFHFDADTELPDCPQLKMLRVNGSIFFGAVEHVEDAFHRVDHENPQQKRLLIVASGINVVDISGAEMLSREAARRNRMGGGLYLWFMKDAVYDLLKQGSYLKTIHKDHILAQSVDPIHILYPMLDSEVCRSCSARIFPQCHIALPNGEPRGATDGIARPPTDG